MIPQSDFGLKYESTTNAISPVCSMSYSDCRPRAKANMCPWRKIVNIDVAGFSEPLSKTTSLPKTSPVSSAAALPTALPPPLLANSPRLLLKLLRRRPAGRFASVLN